MDSQTVERLRLEIQNEYGRNAPPEGFPNLPRIPVARYTDPEFFKLEQAEVFDKSWLYVGSTYEFPEQGSYKVYDNMGRAEIVIIRGNDDVIRAFYNTCQHRGATVLREKSGRLDYLSCQFHSWTYNLEGELIAIPDERDFANDPSLKDAGLHGVRCESWGKFIYINLDDDAVDLETWLGPVSEDFGWAKDLRPTNRHERVIAVNWRVCIEAFIEVYHIGTVHPDSVAKGIDHRGTVSTFYPHGHSRMIVPNVGAADGAPEEIKDTLEQYRLHDEGAPLRLEANISYNIFPNVLVPSGLSGFTLMEFWPIDVNHTRLVTWIVEPDWGDGVEPPEYKERADYFDEVLDEDTWNMEHIQRSYQSPHFKGPKIGVHEKRIYHLEQALDKMIGPEKVPKDMRVEPLLEKYVVHTAQDI
jgi:phenylpropionate dioxygenase-like ring-hydroxylating dioxygenase large terminal subunit